MKISTVKKSCKFAASAFAVLGALTACNVFADDASDTATTSATVVVPIAIVDAQNLSFGEFSAGTGGTVTVTTAGAGSDGGDVVTTGGSTAAAQFTVTGQADASFSIAVSDNDLTHTNATDTMALATVHDLDGATGDDPVSGTLTGGEQTIYVGGTLTVGSAQVPGVYSGTITATVNYN